MQRTIRLAAVVAAVGLLGLAATNASAGRLSLSNSKFRRTWFQLFLSTSGGVGPIVCPVTLEGSFHSATVQKVVGALVGYVSRATTPPSACTGGKQTITQGSLPWHVRYRGFSGRLPNPAGSIFGFEGMEGSVEAGGATCTYRTTAAKPFVGIANIGERGRITGFRADETASIPLSGEFLCSFAGEGRASGTAEMTLLGNTNLITITLI